jgi:beta-galactosidase
VAYHEDRRNKGRALSIEDRKQDMDILTELGCTFIRLSHYQHDQFLYRYCDEHGIIVWTEIPVVNNIDTTSVLYAENAKQQLTELIRQNYNHPSVCFWGVFNEIDYKPGPNPAPLIHELNALAHQLDPTRLTTAAAMFDDRPQHWMPDVISWNKYFGWYVGKIDDFGPWLDAMHRKHPDSKIGVSEYGVGANTQDHSMNPRQPNPGGPYHPEEYQNLYHETHWREIVRHPFLYATAVWVAFDFSSDGRNEGKNPGVNDKGLVTQDRKIKKDAYYFYKANWSNDPVLYISSRRFTQRTDANCEVKVYSNCESVELLINGKKYPTIASGDHIFRCADVMLQPGANTILATGRMNGRTLTDSCTWDLSTVNK